MALTQSKLEAMFAGPPIATEAGAIDFMAQSFLDFFLDATVAGSPAVLAALAPADAAFRLAAVGLSVANQGAARMQAAMTAFWTAALLAAPTVWITVPPIVPASGLLPPGLAGMAGSLGPVFANNVATKADLPTASAALGAAIFAAQSGATVTLAPPPPGGTPLVPVL